MLSSQTKDTVNAEAMKALHNLIGGLTIDTILSTNRELIHDCIRKVGYHNKKLDYLINTTLICRQDYQNDIPNTLEGI